MTTISLALQSPSPYAFAASVCDHGWPALAPFLWNKEQEVLERIERLSNGDVVLLRIYQQDVAADIMVEIESATPLAEKEIEEVRQTVRWMLKLDQDYSAFYQMAAQHPRIGRIVAQGRGRLLRSPTLWEDVVKTIATTNVTWRNTVTMIQRLVDTLGEPYPLDPTRHAFPTPQQVAAADPALFAETIRMGYRNTYVRQLAHEVVTQQRRLDAQDLSRLPAAELKRKLKAFKGVGDYAAHTLLMCLGHYSELPIDSEYRSFVHQRYFPTAQGERPASDKEIAHIYDEWGAWKYLAYWFDHYD